MMQVIGIIGGGFSGVATVLHFLKYHDGLPLKLLLIERRKGPGVGTAYSTTSDHHLLNVPAAKMGAYADDVEHFYRWIQAQYLPYSGSDFVPRKIYCKYLEQTLENALQQDHPSVIVEKISDEALSVSQGRSGYSIELKSGQTIHADKLILALGNYAPAHPPMRDMSFTQSDRYFRDPWAQKALDQLQENNKVLLIGTGLTMIDMILDLHHSGFKGEIVAISRHGYLPFAHKSSEAYPAFNEELMKAKSIQDVFEIVRAHRRRAKKDNIDWRAVIDSLRPHTQQLWLNLSNNEKKKFLRHVNSLWGVLRHRIPPQCAELLSEMRSSGKLKVYAAKLLRMIPSMNNINVVFKVRKKQQVLSGDFSYVLNCTGPHGNYNRVNDPLVRSLMGQGFIQSDPLNMGLSATAEGKIIYRNGQVSESMFTLGPPLKGILGESTAVPEIRQQAAGLAKLISAGSSEGRTAASQ